MIAVYTKEIRVVVDAVQSACRMIMSVYESDFTVDQKDRSEPVTAADRLANAELVARLAEAFPDDGIVAEESVPTEIQLAEQVFRERVWYVDPLDGTKEFIARNGEFSVMVGLCVSGRPVLGVVAQPTVGEMAVGVVGQGAWLVDSAGARTVLQVSEQSRLDACTVLVSRSHMTETVQRIVDEVHPSACVRCGSVGVKITRMAQGRADLYVNPPHPGGSKLWDGCAPDAILVAAGGRVTTLLGAPISYTTTNLVLSGGYLATNGRLHEAAVEAAAGVLRAVDYSPVT
jgi:3'(2'), 5'-bisphosphate nucleotidase